MKKMDEMERNINLNAIKWSWFFTVIALFAWSIFEYMRTRQASVASCLLGMQLVIYFAAGQALKSRVGDERGLKYIVACLVFAALLLAFGALAYFFQQQ
ncbi:hypothetical protein SDC9_110839 [bioreactor metagenome]|uniref:Uncharacterized protein n=1 Tax=bioreactor metagenome TaxID=1076179 RepID=A0A645BQ58_9ZZZZ